MEDAVMIICHQLPYPCWLDLRSRVMGIARLRDRVERTALASNPSHRQQVGGRDR